MPQIFQLIATGIIALFLLLAMAGAFFLTLHRRRQRLNAGTAPFNFPPESVLPVGQTQAGNKTGNTGAFSSTVFFTAPTSGWYELGWAVHIQSTDNAGTITATVTPPHSVAIPGVQAAPATPSDGKGPSAPYYMAGGETVTVAVAVGSLTGTTFDVWVFATRLA